MLAFESEMTATKLMVMDEAPPAPSKMDINVMEEHQQSVTHVLSFEEILKISATMNVKMEIQ